MFTKTLIVALVLASASLSLTKAFAGPTSQPQYQANQETSWMDRASRNLDGAGGN
jgi:hypothetical protein